MSKIILKNKKGQAIVEILALLVGVIISIKSVFVLLWFIANTLWMEHQVYESLICAAEKRGVIFCKNKALNEIKKFNQIGELKNLNIIGQYKNWRGSLDWRIYKWNFNIQSRLNLP